MNLLTDVSEAVIVEGNWLLFFCTQDAYYVAGADIDHMWIAVLDWHSTLIPVVEAD